MRVTRVLCQSALRLTLFTRRNCSLCDDAKQVLQKVWEKRPYEYDEIDVMADGQCKWKDLYEFDTPVVHFNRTPENDSKFTTTSEALKVMHRFSEAQVEELMNKASSPSASAEGSVEMPNK